MQVRHPDFDFTASGARWGENHEAVAVVNGRAIIPAAIERYIIRVLRRARKLLDPIDDARLVADVDTFNQQKGQHAKLHAAYLTMIRDGGCPGIGEFEAAFVADLDRFFETERLAWNLAYCEGFESTGAAMAAAWVDGKVAELCGDHGSVPMQLWMWHLAEEFEHRSVVHDVLHRLYPPDEAFALRTAGADFGRAHFSRHSADAVAYVLEVDRASMAPAEIAASVAREMDAWIAMGTLTGDAFAWVYQPDYDPAQIAPPRDYETILARYADAARA